MATNDLKNFEKIRIKDLQQIYSDPTSARLNFNKRAASLGTSFNSAESVRSAINQALSDKNTLIAASGNYYTTNPIYSTIINYLANMFLWRYVVIPHKLYSGNARKAAPKLDKVYGEMMEIVEGLNLENKIPSALLQLLIEGGVYFTTYYDKESLTINTILLPSKYCRKVGETQFGTSIIKFDFSYFDSLGLSLKEKEEFIETFPEELKTGYNLYLKDTTHGRWQQLDPHYSSCVLLNEKGIPNYIYSLGSIINYEVYGDNELQRNSDLLKYVVVHKMPLYQDQLIFSTEEVAAIHKNLAKIVNSGDNVRLITTYGDVHLEKVSDSDRSENKTLAKAYESIFNNVGLNNTLFTGESVEALKYSLRRDQAIMWQYVEQLMNFYNVAVNNWCDFKGYQAEIQMLQISHYSYQEDITSYREKATLGVGKLDFLVAAGIKQKHISDRLELEDYLKLDELKPLQTSYTQTAEDRSEETKQEETQKEKDPKQEETPKNEPVIEEEEKTVEEEEGNEKD